MSAKTIISFSFVLFLITNSFSQEAEKIEITNSYICSYYGEETYVPIYTFASTSEAENIIERILDVIGLKPNFKIRAANVPNAAAVIYGSTRYILYSPKFISAINNAAGTDWASISILAHEIGHHLNGHTLTETGSRPALELEADEFSGFVLRKMGAKLSDAQRAMSIAASEQTSHTHPARRDRLIAIADGWQHADDQLEGRTVSTKTNKNVEKPVVVPKPKAEPVLAEKFIAFDVQFNADPQGKYYVTTRNNLVKVAENSLYIIGMLANSNKKGYAYMLYDKHYNYLYINANGAVINGAGRKVGQMQVH
jgi:Zn-dependent peptidase ImmA (M78 family)